MRVKSRRVTPKNPSKPICSAGSRKFLMENSVSVNKVGRVARNVQQEHPTEQSGASTDCTLDLEEVGGVRDDGEEPVPGELRVGKIESEHRFLGDRSKVDEGQDKANSRTTDIETEKDRGTERNPWQCDKCDICFESEWKLKKHVRNHVEAICPFCGSIIHGVRAQLERHIRVVHRGEKRYTCDLCEEKFAYHEALYAHRANAHAVNEEKNAKVCSKCSQAFTSRFGLRQHMLNAHGDISEGHSVHSCEICGKKFIDRRKFDEHRRVHLGLKPFACPFCDLRSARFCNMKKHCATIHKRLVRRAYDEKGNVTNNIEDDLDPDNRRHWTAIQKEIRDSRVLQVKRDSR